VPHVSRKSHPFEWNGVRVLHARDGIKLTSLPLPVHKLKTCLHLTTPHWTHDRLEKCSFTASDEGTITLATVPPPTSAFPRVSTLPSCERDGGRMTRHPSHDDYACFSDRLHPRPSLKHDSVQVDTPPCTTSSFSSSSGRGGATQQSKTASI
jgi:hypothetical protein